MADSQIHQVCPQCDGDGVWGAEPEQSCNTCGGVGYITRFKIDDVADILDKCNDIIDKLDDIWEKINE